ncbi:MAG: DNA recombination protein RmuC [Bacteroidetes bacterium]|nr:DNA recombination protein RmuC [Bacteroidota bacterium]
MIDWVAILFGFLLGSLTGALIILLVFMKRMNVLRDEKTKLQAEVEKGTQSETRLKTEFENLANRILENNAQKLSQTHQSSLNQLLDPLKEKLTSFEKRVEDAYYQEARERFNLQKEIEKLVSLNHQMSEDAQNLTRALQGDSKFQGNWGELVLATVLEKSGLREGEEYVVQGKDMKLVSENGSRLQPDVIVNLPDQKHIIIDAKVSLTAYEQFSSLEGREAKNQSLKQHLRSIHNHINQLSEKHYPAIPALQSPDFVLMFMPIEPAFSLAIQHQTDLFQYAWERKIVLVSPTTLLATLKTVASIWKLEHQNANAQEIARQGGALYDKFVGFVEEMEKLGVHLDRASRSHSDAMNKLVNGHGNLATRAEKLRELGVKTNKKISS